MKKAILTLLAMVLLMPATANAKVVMKPMDVIPYPQQVTN